MNTQMMMLSMALALVGCSKVIDPDDIPDETPTGPLEAYLDATSETDKLNSGVEEVWLRLEDTQVHSEDEGWITVGTDRRDIDLMDLRGGLPIKIGSGDVYEGAYDALRLIIADSWIVVDGTEEDLTIARVLDLPGDGFDFNADFFVDEAATTAVSLFWDLDTEIEDNSGEWTLNTDATLNVKID
jgi:hypothetical protein